MKSSNQIPLSTFDEVMITLFSFMLPFAIIVHSSFSQTSKAILIFLFFSLSLILATRFVYKRKKSLALEILIFFGFLNLFLAAISYFVFSIALFLPSAGNIIPEAMKSIFIYLSPVIGFLFASFGLRALTKECEKNKSYI